MARTAKTETGIARANLLNQIQIAVTLGATAKEIQNLITADDDVTEFAVAASTRDAYGGRVMGHVLDAMIRTQNSKCFLCTETFWAIGDCSTPEENGSIPNLFLMVPSQLWADTEIGGIAAHESGYLPGNLIAACVLCTNDRDRATEATKKVVCVDVDSLHPKQVEKILLSFPKGVKKSSINHDSPRIAQRRTIRSNQVGF